MQKQEEILSRLRKIFDIFLRENFATTNNVYFEKLITHLLAKDNEFIVQAPLSIDWVDRCLTLIMEDVHKVHPKVISFMLNFCSYLASNEWVLVKLKERNILNRTIEFMQRDGQEFSPSVKLGCIRLLTTVSKYSMGLLYIRNVRAWTMLIEYSNNDHTLYVVREARQLLYQILYKYSTKMKDDEIVLEIFGEILKPINENIYTTDNEPVTIRVDDTELLHKLSSALDLLSYIFQQTLDSEDKTNITQLLKDHHNIPITIWKLIDMAHDRYFVSKIMTTLTSFNFANLVYERLHDKEDNVKAENFDEFGLFFFNMMKLCVQRTDGITFIELAELNHLLWKKLGNRAPKELLIDNQCVVFEDQLICFHMMPLFVTMKNNQDIRGENFDNYIMKILKITCDQSIRICYSMRDAFCTNDGVLVQQYTPELPHKCIHSILSLENVLERPQAVLVCQALLYLLKEVVMLSSQNLNHQDVETSDFFFSVSGDFHALFPLGSEIVLQNPKVLHSVMYGLQKLIERFKITWKESVETICLVNSVAFLLENRNLDTRSTVQALKLIQLAVEHFLSPNMALLVDNLDGSGLVCLGPIIIKRLHDTAWEVRDTALELTTSIADISRIKFPAFQRFLVQAKIPPIVYQMVQHDSEAYVRASAFKCLSKMVSINMIWENDLSQSDLIDHLLYVLYNENEDIVRTEAILTLSIIYEKRKVPLKYKNTLFSTLNYCIVGDHHWEVKINALSFWKMEFQRQFSNQGMIDGVFPSVTFSKEHKKIVTLTEREIKLRISKVFVEVQQYGYFGVLLKCLKEEYAAEVLKIIVNGVHIMYEKLQKFGIESIIEEVESLTSPDSICSCSNLFQSKPLTPPPSVETDLNTEFADEVIEGILEAQDINLLEKVFDSQMGINTSDSNTEPGAKRHIDEYYYKQFAIPLREYISSLHTFDLEKIVNQQKEWYQNTESFVSLLDDILYAIKRDDENMVSDCY